MCVCAMCVYESRVCVCVSVCVVCVWGCGGGGAICVCSCARACVSLCLDVCSVCQCRFDTDGGDKDYSHEKGSDVCFY